LRFSAIHFKLIVVSLRSLRASSGFVGAGLTRGRASDRMRILLQSLPGRFNF